MAMPTTFTTLEHRWWFSQPAKIDWKIWKVPATSFIFALSLSLSKVPSLNLRCHRAKQHGSRITAVAGALVLW